MARFHWHKELCNCRKVPLQVISDVNQMARSSQSPHLSLAMRILDQQTIHHYLNSEGTFSGASSSSIAPQIYFLLRNSPALRFQPVLEKLCIDKCCIFCSTYQDLQAQKGKCHAWMLCCGVRTAPVISATAVEPVHKSTSKTVDRIAP